MDLLNKVTIDGITLIHPQVENVTKIGKAAELGDYILSKTDFPIPKEWFNALDEIQGKVEHDPLYDHFKLAAVTHFTAQYWAGRCNTSEGIKAFLDCFSEADDAVISAEISGTPRAVVLRNGYFEIIDGAPSTFRYMLDSLESMPAAEGFRYRGKPIKLNAVHVEEEGVKLVFSNCAPVTIYLVVGRTGAGKTHIADMLAERKGMKRVRSYATRPMREGEDMSSDHIFINPEDMEKYREDFAAYTRIGEYEYFTTWDVLRSADNSLYVIDSNGVEYLTKAVKEKNLDSIIDFKVIYVATKDAVRHKRLTNRGDTETVILAREQAEKEQFDRFEEKIKNDPSVLVVDNSRSVWKTFRAVERWLCKN